jgi:hypothetical protein
MPTSDPILRQITLALAIAAIAAPAASARANQAPSETAQSQTAAAGLVARPNPDQQTGQPGTVARPNPDQQTARPGTVVRPNPDQQTGQSRSGGPQSLRPARASDLAAHNHAHAVIKQGSTPPHATGNTPRGVAIGTHPLKQTVNDRNVSTHANARTHSRTDHAPNGSSSPGAGGANLSTLKAIANASVANPAASAPPAITPPSDDFDYGAAALGAGITAAIAVLIAAGTLGLRQRSRTRHP